MYQDFFFAMIQKLLFNVNSFARLHPIAAKTFCENLLITWLITHSRFLEPVPNVGESKGS